MMNWIRRYWRRLRGIPEVRPAPPDWAEPVIRWDPDSHYVYRDDEIIGVAIPENPGTPLSPLMNADVVDWSKKITTKNRFLK